MTRPHEETWISEEVIVMHNRHDGQKDAREVLGAAAPEMARALVAMLSEFPRSDASEGEVDARRLAHEALTKAGVPLP